MKEKKLMNEKFAKNIITCLISLLSICLIVLFFARILTNVSVGAESYSTDIKVELEKYVNFKISDQDKGTLAQYNIKTSIKQEEGKEYSPAKSNELKVSLNQINGKYPYAVKVLAISTELTNGKKEEIKEDYEYNQTAGEVVIKTSNEDEKGEPINSEKPAEDAKDEYIVICYYDTYEETPEEKEIGLKVSLKVVLFEDDKVIDYQNEYKEKVKENISELTSVLYNTDEIYNGYIKSNVINGTTYNTQYTQTQSIVISKKEAQEKLNILEDNTFVRLSKDENNEEVEKDIGNNGKLIYKSTKIKKSDIEKILGEEGKLEILDKNNNVLALIDKDTTFAEDGTVTINYKDEIESIIVKTSEIKNEGILKLENTKEIKSTMVEAKNIEVKTVEKVTGTKEKIEKVNNEDVTTDVETFTNSYENKAEIKDAQLDVNFTVSNTKWTNAQQNEVTFEALINANSTNKNMLKDSMIKIELPSEVEKVILGESSVMYSNGLKLQKPVLEKTSKGNIVICAKLLGTQNEYNENDLGLVTDIKIPASIILNKDMDNKDSNIKYTYTNKFTLDGKEEGITKEDTIQLESYNSQTVESNNSVLTTTPLNTQSMVQTVNVEGLKMEVEPVRGDTVLKEGDTVYEGEFIKYNIKVTNTSNQKMDNVKVIGTIPEGTVYAELDADYYSYQGKYEYKYDENIKEKEINIGSLEAGKSTTVFYEVKVNNLEEGKTENSLISNIKLYINSNQASNYEVNNVVKDANASIFIDAKLDNGRDRWNYGVGIKGEQNKEVEVIIQFPKQFEFQYIGYNSLLHQLTEYNVEEIEDNKYKLKLKVDNTQNYYFEGVMNELKIDKNNNNSSQELITAATLNVDNIEYKSNENRIIYSYRNVSINMTSPNEGEEIKCGEEINYEITLENIGGRNLDISNSYITVLLKDYLPENVEAQTVTYDKWTENEETGEFTKTEVTKNIKYDTYDENGNKNPNIYLSCLIPYKQVVKLKIKTIAGIVYEKTKIENSAVITSDETKVENGVEVTNSVIGTKISNTVAHIIVPDNNNDIIIDDGNNDDSGDIDDGNNDDSGDIESEKYSISGTAWLDENEDGIRQTSEKVLDGIVVMLVNANDTSKVQTKQTTDENGKYNFSELEKGKYIVIFRYDSENYSTTKYQISGKSNAFDSDVITREIKISGNKAIVAITDMLTLDASLQNIDMGIIKNKICDLKLDKYISKVSLKTANGLNTKEYDNAKLAKVEVKAKEIEGAKVVVEYKLVVTNEGELETSVNKVIDYLPEGFEFSSELNNSWVKNKGNEIYNISLTNKKIKPGESIDLTLILTKLLNGNDTKTYTNIAEIGEISNSLGTKDIDSIPGNKADTEDDYSKAELIISISTGLNLYIGLGAAIILGFLTIMFVILKFNSAILKKVSKYFVLIFVFASVIFLENIYSPVDAFYEIKNYKNLNPATYTVPEKAWFEFGGGSDGTTFTGYLYNKEGEEICNGITAICIDRGISNQDNWDGGYGDKTKTYTLDKNSTTVTRKPYSDITGVNIDYEFTKDENVTASYDYTNKKLGPFKFKWECTESKNKTYNIEIKTGENQEIDDFKIVDKDGNEIKLQEDKEFYIELANVYDEIIISVTNETTVKKKTEGSVTVHAVYNPDRGTGYQRVCCDYRLTNENEVDIPLSSKIVWQEKITGSLIIVKKDKQTGEPLKGAKFTVQEADSKKYALAVKPYTGHDGKDYILGNFINRKKYEIRVATTYFETDEEGKIEITKVPCGQYIITEQEAPEGYNISTESTKNITINSEKNEITFENESLGKLKIIKVDKETGEPLKGAKFQLLNKEKKKSVFVERKDNIYKYINMAVGDTELEINGYVNYFETDQNGCIEITSLPKGQYIIREIKAPDGYDLMVEDRSVFVKPIKLQTRKENLAAVLHEEDIDKIIDAHDLADSINSELKYGVKLEWGVNGAIAIFIQEKLKESGKTVSDAELEKLLYQVDGGTATVIYNKKATINLTGYVWKDNKDNVDGFFNTSNKDNLAYGVRVRLMDSTTNEIVKDKDGNNYEIITSPNNSLYTFENVLISKLKDYYIDFSYNGMAYQACGLTYAPKGNGNVSRESGRQAFNNKFATIIKDNAVSSDGERKKLDYYRTSSTSTLKFYEEQQNRLNKPLGYDVNGFYDQYLITARTKANIINDKGEILGVGVNENGTTEFITRSNISKYKKIIGLNLGLYEREMPDIELKMDISSAKVNINGDEREYKEDKNGTTYNLPIYKADLNDDVKLDAYVEYRVSLTNNSNIYTKVNEILIDYNNNYLELNKILIENNNNYLELKEIEKKDVSNSEGKLRIKNLNIELNPKETKETKETKELYITFKLNNKKINNQLISSFAEVTSYSTYNDKKYRDSYGGIDSDSQPENLNISTSRDFYATDEDDSDRSQIQILSATRQIKGNVFEDNNDDEKLQKDNERIGNGKYDDGENKISGIKVYLCKEGAIEINNSNLKLTDEVVKSIENSEKNPNIVKAVETNQDGEYMIEDFAVGNYYIVFRWGNEQYSVLDYKSTVRLSDYSVGYQWYRNGTEPYSDALDDYDLRTKLDEENNSDSKMNSITDKLLIKLDLSGENINETRSYLTKKQITTINNIDFGLIERPRQKVDIEKVVSSVKLSLANNAPIVEADVIEKEDGKRGFKEDVKGVQYIEPTKELPEGQILLTVDNELLQGSTLEINYSIKLSNSSEVDYKNENYYKYGEKGSDDELVKLKIKSIYDYLDKIMPLASDNKWKVCTSEYNKDENKETYAQANAAIKRWWDTQTTEDGTKIENSGYEMMQSHYFSELTEWNDSTEQELRKTISNSRQTLKYNIDNISLEPGKILETPLTLSTSKKLANTSEEIVIKNDTEVTKVIRENNYGRMVRLEQGKSFDSGEEVKIIPPTGQDKAYIVPITVAIVSLGILLGGIILIKKKVLE